MFPSFRQIGLMVEPLSGYGQKILNGISRYANLKPNWRIALFNNERKDLAQLISSWQGDGIICTAVDSRFTKAASKRSIPIINVAGRMTNPAFINVIADDHAVGATAAHFLLNRGFTNFGFVRHAKHATWANKRCRGFVQTVNAAGYKTECLTLTNNSYPLLVHWLNKLPRPIAITGADDQQAATIIEACWRLGIQIPDEIAVLGIGNHNQLCELCSPSLSSLEVDLERRGFHAARIIDEILEGTPPPNDIQLIPPSQVVERRSTNTYAFNDPIVVTAITFIWKNASQSIQVNDVVTATGTSRRNLETRFAKSTGRTLHQEIWNAHFDLATRLLKNTDLRLQEIAQQSGFRTASALANLFRQRFQMTPKAYRIDSRR